LRTRSLSVNIEGMKKSTFVGTLIATFLVSGAASANKLHFHGDLDHDHEVTPPTIDGHNPTGTADFVFDDVSKQLCGKISWTDLTGPATGAHVHQAPPGLPDADGVAPAQGKLIIGLPAGVKADDSVTFNFTLNPAFEASLLAEEIYTNVHTAANAKGESRSTMFQVDTGPDITCPAPTNPDGGTSTPPVPDSGASSSGATSSGGSTSGAASSSSGAASSGAASSGATSSGSTSGEDATKPAADKGCSTSGSPVSALAFAFVVGAGIVLVSSRSRRRRR
jgi:hypothetical protein